MVFKKRLVIWLIRAYIKRWGKIIVLYFFLGLAFFFVLVFCASYILPRLPIGKKEIIGVVGSYQVDSIPDTIMHTLSRGLTVLGPDDVPHPDIALSWGIEDNGKKYVFRLRSDVFYTDGERVTSKNIPLSFRDVKIQRPNLQTIVFQLKEPYAPFLVTLSHPIFKSGFIGTGEYKVKNLKLNGNFVESLTIGSMKDPTKIRTYEFYPSVDALKIGFALGEVTIADGLPDIQFKNIAFDRFPNAVIEKKIDYSQLVTLFYNNADKNLNDKRLRDALTYALPNTFMLGERAYSPLSPKSWAFTPNSQHFQDLEHAKLLLQAAGYDAKNPSPGVTITTSLQYEPVAKAILSSWKVIGIKGNISVGHTIPSNFQIYLGSFHLPKDPDQYTLWHSDQGNNITNYKNLRIDKLLEDGRKTLDQTKRLKIYADFQKYLLDDQPASFLYFPFGYTVSRK